MASSDAIKKEEYVKGTGGRSCDVVEINITI